ncbi:ABC transporter ATP-binding protein/permease [Microbacterium lacus]|uniref:ABC transporter ATP-binding protein n=1 Tax=Microbacterium lacus TaxID=415217 RepID=UPI00384BD0DA
MGRSTNEPRLADQLALVLRMAGASPARWVTGTVAGSIVLAALDTIGVAAMVPLMQLVTTGDTTSGAAGLISSALGIDDAQRLIPIVAGFVAGIFIVKSIAAVAFRWWLLGRTTRISALSSVELMRRYVLSPYSAHRSRRMSEVYRNINDSTTQSASVLLGVVSLFTDALMLIAITTVLAITSPLITLFTVVLFVVLIFGVQRLLRARQSRIGEELSEASLESWQFLMPALEGFREARLSSSANVFVDGFLRARLRRAHASRLLGVISDAPRYLLEIGFVLAILGISAILFTTGTPAEALTVLGVFAAASIRALPTMNRLSANLVTIRTGRAGLNILTRVMAELESGGSHNETPGADTDFSGDIDLREVTFQYPDAERPVLDKLSLRIAQNRTTAFVGSSGAGKSTLLDVILGLLEPTEGAVQCGGKPILDDRAAWYRGLSVVPQDVFLMNTTVAGNIAFGVSANAIDHALIERVVLLAQLDELIAELPDGLDTVVGERGVRLSGGQRQRLGLARALYRQPKILVLDEATSALDNATEHEIAATLAGLGGTMTILIVAHRLSTIRGADELVFLKDGLIETKGTFEEVRRDSAEFARLVKLGDLS